MIQLITIMIMMTITSFSLVMCVDNGYQCSRRHKANANDCFKAADLMMGSDTTNLRSAAWTADNCAIVISRVYSEQTTNLTEISAIITEIQSKCFGVNALQRSGVFQGNKTHPKVCICGRGNVASCY
ncbi:hypothetical protein V1517DRAFT_334516 [Lipomyces orientalis]|uniref:Uncharacterized protein n=1 Tax=Lipomyces orientalis TaxID=1233043 RepID=A0ACC3TCB1_9ASCO